MGFPTRKHLRILWIDWIRRKASLARGRLRHSDHTRIKNEENNVDPDDGNSWFFSACTLPIFFTPFKEISHHDHTKKEDNGRGGGGSSSNGRRVFLHDQCANLPEQIGHVLHPQLPLNLKKNQLPTSSTTNDITTSNCTNCSRKCGSLFYGCADMLFREAKLADLLHFPLADEQASVMHYIMENVDTRDHGYHRSHPTTLHRRGLHQHELILLDYVQPGQPSSHVCNACVQFISPPFYSCVECPDFFLHSCCVNLPREIIKHTSHRQHTLHLLTLKHTPSSTQFASFARFQCNSCWRQCNGFAYACKRCDFVMDVVCALMPSSITHESHGKAHILYVSYNKDPSQQSCKCCNTFLPGIWYECSTCHNFKIHANCALLPKTIVWRTFDDHPLKLTTKPRKSVSTRVGHDVIDSKEAQQFCEICEEDMLKGVWYYNCSQCDKSFHINCIPVDTLSKIKFGLTIKVWCHGCRLTLVRHSTVHGCRCGLCRQIFTDVDAHELFAYECSKCNNANISDFVSDFFGGS